MRAAIRSVLFSAIQGIDLDFVRGRYASNSGYRSDFLGLPGATYTRAGAATAETAAGAIINFAANVPRVTDRGVLIEEARTNLLLGSQVIGTAPWGIGNGGVGQAPTITQNYATAPDGTLTATRAQFSLGGGTTGADQSLVNSGIVTVVNGSSYTLTIYLKSNDASSYVLQLIDGQIGGSNAVTVTPAWQRFSRTVTTTSTSSQLQFRLRGGATPTNSPTADILAWGAQLELGATPSSYIPTTAAAATRAADIMYVPNGVSTTQSIVAEGSLIGVNNAAATTRTLVSSGTSDGGTGRVMLYFSSSNVYPGYVQVSGADQAVLSVSALVGVGAVFRLATSVSTNDVRGAYNGTLATPDTLASAPAAERLSIGTTFAGGSPLNGYVRSIVYRETTLTNAQLQALTA